MREVRPDGRKDVLFFIFEKQFCCAVVTSNLIRVKHLIFSALRSEYLISFSPLCILLYAIQYIVYSLFCQEGKTENKKKTVFLNRKKMTFQPLEILFSGNVK